jgi:alkylation response protein AidB-like acyl-CoA dehydrogenase
MTAEASVRRAAASAAVPVMASRTEALERVRALLPAIAARAKRTDKERRTPDETIAELRAEGLFGVVTPKSFGGSQLGFGAMVEITAEIAAVCGSTGWVYGVLTGHNWMLGLFSAEAQAEVFGDSAALTASVFRLGGVTTPVDGGYRLVGGEGRFCSGIDHSSWVIVGASAPRPDGPPQPLFLLIPISDVEIVDDWFTAGMRGTGSRSIRIADAFVPAHRAIAVADMAVGKTPGALHHNDSPAYSLPFGVGQPFSLIGAPLGMARGALATAAESMGKKFAAMSLEQSGEQGAAFARIAAASADIDAAFALIEADCARLDAATLPLNLPPLARAGFSRDLAYAAQKCRYAVTSLFEAGGGSGVYDSAPMQRYWRDINAAAAHAAFTWDDAAPTYGRALLGLPPSKFARK